jgi:hypothetical protein
MHGCPFIFALSCLLWFSHVSRFFYILYYFGALCIAFKSWRRSVLVFATPFALSCIGFLLVLKHRVDLKSHRRYANLSAFTSKVKISALWRRHLLSISDERDGTQ